jgi:hypothetical protein
MFSQNSTPLTKLKQQHAFTVVTSWGGGGVPNQPNAITAKRAPSPNSNVIALDDIQQVIVQAAACKKYFVAVAYVAIL